MGALGLFREYMGVGLILIWYLIVLLYLFWKEKRRERRLLFLYVPFLILLIFFNPLVYRIFDKLLGEEIFYRMLWLLPVTVTLSYGTVKICGSLSGKRQIAFGITAALLIGISGKLVYTNSGFTVAENIHHVPQEVVTICDMIEVPGIEVMAVFPLEMLHYVRQYSEAICMPYGREVLVNEYSELEYVLHYEEVDVSRLASLSKEQKCHYVILGKEKKLIGGRMEDFGYELIGDVGNYLVYRDNTSDFYGVTK
ncbi:MAG: hypothetical protein II477_03975 [Lachnospiraceae bacterium]|nr:hypothetical protein [Lachnospiraceae bacterium]MBQ2100216.1 hypothetical protein [Lachnospiraceae bacterium]